MLQPIKVTYVATNDIYDANQLLQNLANYPIIACDFETAIKYTPADIAAFQSIIDDPTSSKSDLIRARSCLAATALDHASHITLTHCSIAYSETEAYVFILDSPRLTKRILNFLTTTTITQVWHNLSYDGRLIYYHTGKFPINYEDSQLLAKSILNHVDTEKARVGLKELAGSRYGQWAISPDNFSIDMMYDDSVKLYAATDACATFWLYHSIRRYVNETLTEPGV